MGILDYIKNLFFNKKTHTKIVTQDLTKIKGDLTSLECYISDKDGNKLPNKKVTIEINGIEYVKTTDENGIAKLNINLGVGSYTALITFNEDDEYNKSTAYAKVVINPKVEADDLEMTYQDGTKYQVIVKDNNNNILSNEKILFLINGLTYERNTNNEGIASLNINLDAGDYEIGIIANTHKEHHKIHINKAKTRMEGTNVNMTYKDGSKYQCAIYNHKNERIYENVDININGVDYNRTPDENGLYKISINLNPGEYDIKAIYHGSKNYIGSEITNKIKIKEIPKKESKQEVQCSNPYNSKPHPTASGCNAMGQNNSVYCAPSSVHKILYKFGIRDITQGQLASWMGTGSAGTSHSGIETGIAMVNNRKGTKISIKWYNFSDLGWDGIGKIICQPNKDVIVHNLYRNQWGHYETINQINTHTGVIQVLNSLGSSCGSCYCGYVESRAASTFRSYISGISQKSIAVVTLN